MEKKKILLTIIEWTIIIIIADYVAPIPFGVPFGTAGMHEILLQLLSK